MAAKKTTKKPAARRKKKATGRCTNIAQHVEFFRDRSGTNSLDYYGTIATHAAVSIAQGLTCTKSRQSLAFAIDEAKVKQDFHILLEALLVTEVVSKVGVKQVLDNFTDREASNTFGVVGVPTRGL